MTQPIGATCTIQWIESMDHSPDLSYERYLSFGEYDEEQNADEFGVPDDDIFFYCSGVDELEDLKVDCDLDFIVIDYKLEYEYERA